MYLILHKKCNIQMNIYFNKQHQIKYKYINQLYQDKQILLTADYICLNM